MLTKQKLAKEIKSAVKWLIKENCGCSIIKLDDRLAVCVGWLSGYGNEKRGDVIQAKDEPDYGITAGIKVWTSDSLGTDYEWFNFPYYKNGDVIDSDMSIASNSDYEMIAKDLLEQYDQVKGVELNNDGMIFEEELLWKTK